MVKYHSPTPPPACPYSGSGCRRWRTCCLTCQCWDSLPRWMHSAYYRSPKLTSTGTRWLRVISCGETCVWGSGASSPSSAWVHRHGSSTSSNKAEHRWRWHNQRPLSTKKQLGTSIQAEGTLEVPSYPLLPKTCCFRKKKERGRAAR